MQGICVTQIDSRKSLLEPHIYNPEKYILTLYRAFNKLRKFMLLKMGNNMAAQMR